jgi:hypothetical protein
MDLNQEQINQIVETAKTNGLGADEAMCAGTLAKITGDPMASIRFLDYFGNRELYWERVESGWYEKQ